MAASTTTAARDNLHRTCPRRKPRVQNHREAARAGCLFRDLSPSHTRSRRASAPCVPSLAVTSETSSSPELPRRREVHRRRNFNGASFEPGASSSLEVPHPRNFIIPGASSSPESYAHPDPRIFFFEGINPLAADKRSAFKKCDRRRHDYQDLLH